MTTTKVGHGYSKLDTYSKAGVWVPQQGRDIPGVVRFDNCVVLYVTLEKRNMDVLHKYNDQFLVGGTMFQWESQNKNTLETSHIKMILERKPVVLFARVNDKKNSKALPFIYVGTLEYLSHIVPGTGVPIEVGFKVSDYQNPANEALSTLYEWVPGASSEKQLIDVSQTVLTQVEVPTRSDRSAQRAGKTNSQIKIDWAERSEMNRNLGLAGELLVLEFEKQKLKGLGRYDLADKVNHIAIKSDSDGYDIVSYDEHGDEMFIEVKTTKQGKGAAFFISKNEVEVSRTKGKKFWIYRVYDLKDGSDKAKFFALQGPVEDHFYLVPESYMASLK
ncbi:DUF3427 domain-containing protein [Shewanella algae]|uniref:DUF3427 domain-containing protein n=1 Tax=Shewanella algae TaxID=38313 RepID=UPI003B674864